MSCRFNSLPEKHLQISIGIRVTGYIYPGDEAVAKPETYGMTQGRTAASMGMMTYIRVLAPEMYDKVMTMVKEDCVENLMANRLINMNLKTTRNKQGRGQD